MAKGFAGWLFGLLSDDPKPKKQSAPDLREYYKDPNTIEFRCPGVYYHMDEIMKLARTSKLWSIPPQKIVELGRTDVRIYKYRFSDPPAKLVPEPSNAHDPNAVYVDVGGVKVGYAPAGLAPELRRLISAGRIDSVSTFVGGGPYRIITSDGDEFTDEGTSIFVRVTVSVR